VYGVTTYAGCFALTGRLHRDLCTKDSFRSSKAKMIEKPEFTGVNEDFEIIFNAAGAGNMNRAYDGTEH